MPGAGCCGILQSDRALLVVYPAGRRQVFLHRTYQHVNRDAGHGAQDVSREFVRPHGGMVCLLLVSFHC